MKGSTLKVERNQWYTRDSITTPSYLSNRNTLKCQEGT